MFGCPYRGTLIPYWLWMGKQSFKCFHLKLLKLDFSEACILKEVMECRYPIVPVLFNWCTGLISFPTYALILGACESRFTENACPQNLLYEFYSHLHFLIYFKKVICFVNSLEWYSEENCWPFLVREEELWGENQREKLLHLAFAFSIIMYDMKQ